MFSYVLTILFYSMFYFVPVFETVENERFDSNIFLVVNLNVHLDLPLIVNSAGLVESVLKKYVYDIVLATEEIYRRPTMRMPLKINVKNIRYLWSIASVTQMDIMYNDVFLKYYCDWQSTMKYEEEVGEISVIITGFEQMTHEFTNSYGISYLGGTCMIDFSCIVLGFDKRVAYIAVTLAHELAHSLGVPHDDETVECYNPQNYMSSIYDSDNPLPTTWSNCSRSDLNKFLLNSSYSWCIEDDSNRMKIADLHYDYENEHKY